MTTISVWNPSLYQQKHSFVYQYGESLVDLLAPQPGENILDLGCGSGELTQKISETGAKVTGIDASADMIARAQENFPQIRFAVMDAAQMNFSKDFDALFSNATIHWISNQVGLASQMYQSLVPGGRMVVEFGGEGNVWRIRQALQSALMMSGYTQQTDRSIWYFPSIGQYTTLLEKAGFQVHLAQLYDRDTVLQDSKNGIKDWLRMFAGAFLEGIPEKEQESILTQVQDSLKPTQYRDGVWYADYKRIRVVAVKPNRS